MTFAEVVVGPVVVVVVAALVFPVMAQHQGGKPLCASRIRQVANSARLYANDSDGHFPDARQWSDALDPYLQTDRVHVCTAFPGSRYAHAMHDWMSLAHPDKIARPESQVLFFESSARIRNAHGDESLFPKPGPHEGGFYVAYADIHVRMVRRGIR